MKQSIDHVITAAMLTDESPINVLYFGYGSVVDSLLANDGCNYYTAKGLEYCKYDLNLPSNFTLLDKGIQYIPNRIDLHVVVVNSRYQLQNAQNIAHAYHLPLVLIEHELPGENSTHKLRKYVNSRLPSNIVRVERESLVSQEWLSEDKTTLIPYSIPSFNNIKRTENIVITGGDNNPYDREDIKELLSLENSVYYGVNTDLTNLAPSCQDLFKIVASSKIHIHLSDNKSPPILPLISKLNGSITLINDNRRTKNIITAGVDGFLFKNIKEAKEIVRRLDRSTISYVIRHSELSKGYYDWNINQKSLVNLFSTLARKAYIR